MHIQYDRQLDGFRFLAVLAVLLYHFVANPLLQMIPLGFGVFFFFVLSSFLITRILLVAKDDCEGNLRLIWSSLGRFYSRRFLRIFPVYYFIIALMFIVDWEPCREIIVPLLTYTINFTIAGGREVGDFIHFWSLSIEEQFYIFFPLLVFFTPSKYLFRVFIVLIIVGVVSRFGLYLYRSENVYFSNFNSLAALDSLGFGALLAYLYVYRSVDLQHVISSKVYFLLVSLFFISLMIFTYSIHSGSDRFNLGNIVFLRLLFNFLSFWIIGWAVLVGYKGLLGLILENSIVMYLGRISYGIYLFHLFVPKVINLFLRSFFQVYGKQSLLDRQCYTVWFIF